MKDKPNRIVEIFRWLWGKFGQFIKFNLVGLVNTGITFSVSLGITYVFHIHEIITYPIGYVCGLINSFIMNKFWTFGKKHHFGVWEIVKFVIVNMVALGGSEVIIKVSSDVLKFAPVWGVLLGLCFSIPTNYLGFKYWVFKD